MWDLQIVPDIYSVLPVKRHLVVVQKGLTEKEGKAVWPGMDFCRESM